MRFLKKVLVSVYIFLAVFSLLVFISWVFIREEPSVLIGAVFGASGVEFIVSAMMKLAEIRSEETMRREERQHQQNGGE